MVLLSSAAALSFLRPAPAQAQSVPVTVGYRDFYFGTQVNSTPTGEKAESKLWWNDGLWWGSLWDATLGKYAIHKYNQSTQCWTSTGVAIDNRTASKTDVLWDGTHLYIASHTGVDQSGRLYRYSYNTSMQSYSLDAGFPVNVNNSKSEALVLSKDSTDQLWVTWVEGGKVKINRTTGTNVLNSYLRFAVSGLSGAVLSAKLRLNVVNASTDGGEVYAVSNDYNSTATPLSVVGIAAVGNWVEFVVTAAISGNGTFSFGLKNNSSDDVHYSSREGTNKPELVVQFVAGSLAGHDSFEDATAPISLPEGYRLNQNYPNPFNGQTIIEYALPAASEVRLGIYNSLGQIVRRLVEESQSEGYKRVLWDGRDDYGVSVGSGVYFYQLEADLIV